MTEEAFLEMVAAVVGSTARSGDITKIDRLNTLLGSWKDHLEQALLDAHFEQTLELTDD